MNYLLALIILFLIMIPFFQTDDTDKSFFKRSGLSLYTDYKTGFQYLGNGRSLTPRLDAQGKHMRIGE